MSQPNYDDIPLVDSHFHIYTPDLPLAGGAWHKPQVDAGVDRLISVLDAHGVLFGVVAAASLHGEYNDHVRAALQQHKRLRATAIVSPTISAYELQRMNDDGFVGIRLMWSRLESPPDLEGPEYQMLLRRLADLGWHVHMVDRLERMERSMEVIERSGATLVIDHMGMPGGPLGLDDPRFRKVAAALERGRVWLKLSAGFRFNPPESAISYAQEYIRITGGERLVWGSDWPFAGCEDEITYAQTLEAFARWVPDPAMRRRIAGRNPLQLYFSGGR